MILSETIKACRKMAGLTQGELADLSGVSQTTIGAYERGKYDPTQTVDLLLNAMGLELRVGKIQE
ncbi:MAG: helix-turn-helix transcriptional regulator [Clostridiales bacterium]|nr:helix-turn-helix transcriptional regulator [Clostridiales bacterium]MBQ1570586.1 helix-turn-helix transcriptional regulator [Clostridiales bacterium]